MVTTTTTTKAKGNKVKNPNSLRFVPLAQPVLDAGFLAYVEEVRAAGVERLFPDLPNSTGLGLGRQLSRQFSTYIKRQGVEEGRGLPRLPALLHHAPGPGVAGARAEPVRRQPETRVRAGEARNANKRKTRA